MYKEVRPAEEKDIPKLLQLLIQVNKIHHDGRPDLFKLATKYSEQDLKNILADPDQPVFTAVDENDEVIGYGFTQVHVHAGERLREDCETLYIDDICVDENARRQHIGQHIYSAIREYAIASGCHNIVLHVWALNPTAQKFYESLGMKPQYTAMEEIVD